MRGKLLLFFLLVFNYAVSQSYTFDSLLNLVLDTNVKSADKIITDYQKQGGETYLVYLLKGKLRKHHQLYSESIDYLKEALNSNESCQECMYDLSSVFFLMEEYDSASYYNGKLIKLNDRNDKALFQKAIMDVSMRKIDAFDAIELVQEAIEISPDEYKYHVFLGELKISKSLWSLGVASYERAIELNNKCGECHYALAKYYLRRFEYDKAMLNAMQGIEIDKYNRDYYLLKSQIEHNQGRVERAILTLKDFLKVDNLSYPVYRNLGVMYFSLEEMDSSCLYYNKAKNILDVDVNLNSSEKERERDYLVTRMKDICDSSTIYYYYHRGVSQYNKQNLKEAIMTYKKGLNRFPNSPMLHQALANAYLITENKGKAIEEYKKSLLNKHFLPKELLSSEQVKQGFINKETMINSFLVESYLKISQIYKDIGSFKESLIYADSSILLAESNKAGNNKTALELSYLNKSQLYMKQSDCYLAKQFANKALAIIDVNTGLSELEQAKLEFFCNRKKSLFNNLSFMFKSQQKAFNKDLILKEFKRETLLKAIDWCDKSISINKNNGEAYLFRAKLKWILDDKSACFDANIAREILRDKNLNTSYFCN